MAIEEFPKKELQTLWAPWRVEYFEKEPRELDFLSEAARTSDDAAHFVITRRKNGFLIMNRYPYAVGHLMAVPYRKTAELSALGDNEIVELWSLVAHAQALLRAATKAQGFNIGLNLGECAGAGVICTFTLSRAGVVTRTLCRFSREHASSVKACARFMTSCWKRRRRLKNRDRQAVDKLDL
ncbi:MAG: hypothetical protein DME65_00825 [Verrucomicrobia bacterium]|nr:MAG: hypothetical protein DME65_00825 [Verrucomicrobiota bacterium]